MLATAAVPGVLAGPRTRGGRQAGFGLLEVIVALVLLGSTGVALFSWLEQSMSTARRLQEVSEDARTLRLSQALLSQLNPAIDPNGELQEFGIHQQWQSELIRPEQAVVIFAGAEGGPWRAGLYRVRVEAQAKDSGRVIQYEAIRLGRRKLVLAGEGR